MRYGRIPDETVQRLPSYLRAIRLVSERGQTHICSRGLAEIVYASPPQIRKDLSYFGSFGIPGKGYDVEELARHLSGILKLDRPHKAALVGANTVYWPRLRVSTKLTSELSFPARAEDNVVSIGLLAMATATGSGAMPSSEPGPIGTLRA